MNKNLKVLQEEISDCGVCSLLSIIRYYGGSANLEELRINTNTTNKGVSAFNLVMCAKDYGFDAKGLRIEDIKTQSLPVIAHLIINQSLSHFVVVYKIKNDAITVMDPASGFKDISINDFNQMFTGIVISLVPKTIIKKDDYSNMLKDKLVTFIKRKWRSLLLLVLLNLLIVSLSIVNSFYIDFIYVTDHYIRMFIVFSIVVILMMILEYITNIKSEEFKIIISKYILKDFYKHVFHLPLKYIHIKDSGEIIKRVNDLESIKDVLVNSFVVIISNFLIIFSLFIVIYIFTKPVFLLIFIFSLLYICIAVFLYKDIMNKLNEVIITSTNYNTKLQDFILGLTSIKHNNVIDLFLSKLNKYKDNDYYNLFDYQKYIYRINFILEFIFQMFMLIIYTYLFINVKSNFINVDIIIILSLLLNMLYKSLNDIIHVVPSLYYVKTITNKINNFYSIKEDKSNSVTLDNYNIVIKDLTFSYNRYKNIINNLDLRIKRGEKVIFKGESGKGKSTLCKLIIGDFDNYEGSIKIGDKEVKNNHIEEIAYASQEEYIFNGTIKDNILLGRIVDENRFNDIVRVCCLDRIVASRVHKYDTYLYDGGKELSGGERNLIILARTLVDNSNIIILDETLAELNDEVEDKVLHNLFEYYKDKTIIYVSHKNKKNYFKRAIYV